MSQFHVFPFNRYVLRTPAFPINSYFELMENYTIEKLIRFYEEPFLKEAIQIASPELMNILNKWDFLSVENKEALEITLLKYCARISSRCTPFGIFAGCSVGTFQSNLSMIGLTTKEHFSRVTQFDMHFWVSLLQHFSKRKEINHILTYYPNNSIYSIGDYFRYNEYKYVKTHREHSITALKKSEYLETVFEKAKLGITIDEMLLLLAENETEKEDALEFIYDLINFQFLVSELDATLTETNEFKRVYSILKKSPSIDNFLEILQTIETELSELDSTIIPSENKYKELKTLLLKTGVEYDEKYLFQTDLNTSALTNSLNSTLNIKVKAALSFLNSIQASYQPKNQKAFINAFEKRYETKEVPLTIALDTEIGIGYLQNTLMNDTNPILDKFTFKNNEKAALLQNWSPNDFILEAKLQNANAENSNVIILSESDFPDSDSDFNNVPVTFSVMVEIIKNDNQETVYIDSSGDVSAAKLLARFCNTNESIYDLTKEIIQKEESFCKDKILAEIVHIPESRTGNILRRPILRDYEIPYLCNSAVKKEFQIEVSDLMVSVKNNRIVLKSKKFDKEVIPCLSNAHNYHKNSLPIYHFLCDLQLQNLKPIYSFSWGVLEEHYNYFPRVIYNDVILSKAKWKVTKVEIKDFYSQYGVKLFENFTMWKNSRNIPKYVNWVHFDNTLLLDLEKEIGIQLFLKSVKNFEEIILQEFLINEDSIVKNTIGESFTNQVIMSFYKEKVY